MAPIFGDVHVSNPMRSDREAIAGDALFAIEDAHIEVLPRLLATAMSRAQTKNGFDAGTRIISVKIARNGQRLEFVIRCGDRGKDVTLVYDVAGTFLEERHG